MKPFSNLSRLLIAVGIFLIIATIAAQFANWLGGILYGTDLSFIAEQLSANHNALSMADARSFRFSQGVSSALGFMGTALILPLIFRERIGSFLAWNKSDGSKYIEAFLIMMVGIPFLGGLIAWNESIAFPLPESALNTIRNLEEINNRAYELMLRSNRILDIFACILVMAVIPALGEEWLFRGVLFKIFEDWTGRKFWAAIITTVIFALIHFQLFKIVPMMVLGMLFGLIRAWSNSIWPGVWLHFVNNSLAVVGYVIASKNNSLSFLDPDYVFPLSVQIISAILFILLVFRFYMNRETQAELEHA